MLFCLQMSFDEWWDWWVSICIQGVSLRRSGANIARERIGISKITETKVLYFEREIFFNSFQFFNIVRGGNRGGGQLWNHTWNYTHVVTCIFDSKLNMFISIHTVKSTLTQAHKFEIYTDKLKQGWRNRVLIKIGVDSSSIMSLRREPYVDKSWNAW